MTLDQIVMAVLGTVILASLALAHFVNPNWIWLTAFVGVHMLQMSVTGFCPAAIVLKKLGVKPGCALK